MKTKLFLSALTICLMLTTFVACDKDEPYVDPNQVIESELVDPGNAEDVQELDEGTDGLSLSYESWIVIHQVFADGSTSEKTRASESIGEKISVILTNNIVEKDTTIDVSGFELEEGFSNVEYHELGKSSHLEQRYVTVIDSAVVYSINRGIFTIEFVLPYQVAVYDDGITKVTMPYHKYYDIKDLGGALSDIRREQIDGVDYECGSYKHTLSVFFNGKEYEIILNALLRKKLIGDFLISKSVINEGIDLVSCDLENKTGVSKSWIEIEEKWSESGTKKVKKEILLYNGLPDDPSKAFQLSVTKQISCSSLQIAKEEGYVSDCSERVEEEFTITKHLSASGFLVTSSEDVNANAEYKLLLTYETAVYADGYITYNMPYFVFENATCSINQISDWQDDVRGLVMPIRFSLGVSFSSIRYSFESVGEIIFPSI